MKKILVIDNDPEILELLKSRLEANQYQVILASDGEDGLQKAEAELPALIIVDIKMPKVDGYTFIQKLRRVEGNKKTPVVVVTAYANMKELFGAEGIKDYLVKPFDAGDLLRKIELYMMA